MKRSLSLFRSSMIVGLAALTGVATTISGRAQTPAPVASSDKAKTIALHNRTLRNGTHVYTATIHIGAATIEAGVDSGSTGLRVLQRFLSPSDYRSTDTPTQMAYGSGAVFAGFQAQSDVVLGDASGPLTLEVITDVHCLPTRPRCPASRIAPDRFAIMGDGEAGQGFAAIMGIKPVALPVPNPLAALGAKTWILDIPQGDEDGRITLDPSPATVAPFAMIPVPSEPLGKLRDAMHGCLRNDDTQQSICGLIELDTGAPGILVSSPDALPNAWDAHAQATLQFQDGAGAVRAVTEFRAESGEGSRISFKAEPDQRNTIIHAGILPYLCFNVLYAPDAMMMGLLPKDVRSAQPRCRLVSDGTPAAK